MKQLIQNFKSGKMKLEDVPIPSLREGTVLISNAFSLISPGTERNTVQTAQSSLLAKARKRPDLVKQVIQNIKKEGLVATLKKVNTKLDNPKALGYSSCGVVVDSKDFEAKFKAGDRVACAGQDYASHAEVVCVPQNLVVKIPDNVSFKEASFVTIGAIALQGLRQADVKIGERVCVIGLGLIGQITLQLLKVSGCLGTGVDVSDFKIELAKKAGADFVINRKDKNLYERIDEFTKGHGFDKVIITASSSDNDPLILATEILRKKGLIVVVGNIKLDIPREPHFYKKELEVKMATSYGPGRYDQLYEEAGVDYPFAYVRFTQNRNMEVFLQLLSKGSINLEPLITHVFDFGEVEKAYELILNNSQGSIGVLLKYKGMQREDLISKVTVSSQAHKNINIGFIGAGSFVQSYLLPHLKGLDVSLDTVVTTKGITAKNVADKFGFGFASTNPKDVNANNDINTVFIATHHNTHAEYLCAAIKNKKNAFVEKPLALNVEELKQIASIYKGESIVLVGFNRRFSLLSLAIKNELNKLNTPVIMNFRINAGFIPNEYWIQNPDIGGGRIIGEICHFIDLMMYFSGAKPKRVYATSIGIDGNKWRKDDNITIAIEFDNGSLGNITYSAMGDSKVSKERLEVSCAANTYIIDDFKSALFLSDGKSKKIKGKGKGHKEEMQIFIDSIRMGKTNPIEFEDLLYTTLTTFKIAESLKSKTPKDINLSEIYK